METVIIFTVLSNREDQDSANFYVPKKVVLEELSQVVPVDKEENEGDQLETVICAVRDIADMEMFRDAQQEKLFQRLKKLFRWRAEFDPSDSEEEEEESSSEEEEQEEPATDCKKLRGIDWCPYEGLPTQPILVVDHIILQARIWG